MDVLSVGGKDYVKASVIARDLGYTADYVGQLCRSHRVNAKLVGRSWYVDRDSIHVHKSNRYRSTQAKSKESLQETLEVTHAADRGSKVPVHISHSSVGRPKSPAFISYSEDPADLLPPVSKSRGQSSIPVGLADATEVSITSVSDRYVFQTPSLPEIKFKGKVRVNNLEDEQVESAGVEKRTLHPKWVFGNDKKKARNLANSSIRVHITKDRSSNLKTMPKSATSATSTAPHTIPVVQVPENGTVAMVIEENETTGISKWALFATTAVSLCLTIFLLGAESQVAVSGDLVTVTYSFTLHNLTASAYSAFENFRNTFYLVEFSTNLFIF